MHNNTHFVLSYELLYLLRWLIDNNADAFRKMVFRAITNQGVDKDLRTISMQGESMSLEDTQHNIVEFLALLEKYMNEALSEQVHKRARETKLIPTIGQIDSSLCDSATVQSSLEKTAHTLDHNPTINAEDQLFKELLKQWRPQKKAMLN